jgi:hypothetical protein
MASATRGVVRKIVRGAVFPAIALYISPSTVFAQFVPPSEVSFGVGVLRDQSPSQWSPAAVGAVSWDWDENWRAAFVVEGEIAALSEAQPCRLSPDDPPANCSDAALLSGLRFRPTPRSWSGVSYFGSVLLGGYWKGSGIDDDQEYISTHFAMQFGGGVEFRWPNSIQGVRVSVDYRHVFAGDRDRNQFRFLGAYVIGPRRFKARPTG